MLADCGVAELDGDAIATLPARPAQIALVRIFFRCT